MVEEWNAAELARSSEWLTRLARGLVGDRADAEDVVQDSWLAFLQGSGARARSVQPFLAGIVRRVSSVHRRGSERRIARERVAARPESLPSARDVAERLELQRRLVECLLSLNESQRSVLYLRYYEGLDAPEIAAREGLTPAAVRKRIERALVEMRTRLDARSDDRGRDWRLALVPWCAGGPRNPVPAPPSAEKGTSFVGWGAGTAAAVALVLAVAWTWSPGRTPARSVAGGAAPELLASSVDETTFAVEPAEVATSARRVATDPPKSVHVGDHRVVARVLGPDDRPVAGATLSVPETRVEATSDSRGDVVLVIPPETFARVPRAPGVRDVWVEVRATGFATRRIVRATSTPDTTWLGEVRLALGHRITGRVQDENGVPVAGARVVVRPARSLEFEDGREPLFADDVDAWQLEDPSGLGFGPNPDPRVGAVRRVVTGADGRFEIAGLEAGTFTLDATADDRPWSRCSPVRLGAGEPPLDEIVFSLSAPVPDRFVHVRVVDAEQVAVPHATVVVTREGRRQASFGTDESGRLRMRAQTGPWSVTAIATHRNLGPRDVAGLDASTREVELSLPVAEHVDVHVVDEDGTPVRSGIVQATPVNDDRPSLTPWTRLDLEGHARVVVPDRSYRLYVEAHGHAAVHTPAFGADEGRATVHLARAADSWTARVVENGLPLVGARVTRIVTAPGWRSVPRDLWCGEGEPFVYSSSEVPLAEAMRARLGTVTDAEGRFIVSDSPVGGGEPVRFLVESPRGGAWCSGPVVVDVARAANVVLDFAPGGTIEGRLDVDEGTRSAAGWCILACSTEGVLARASVDPTGRYALDGLPAGAWQVRAFSPGAELVPSRGAAAASAGKVDVVLSSGARVTHDVAVSTNSSPVLRCRIAVDGRTDGVLWTASVRTADEEIDRHGGAPTSPGVVVGPDGRFELPLPRSRPCTVYFKSSAGLARWEIRDSVEAARGVIVRDYDIATGEIRGALHVPEPREPAWVDYAWSGGGSLKILVREIADTASGVVPLTRVPCGAGRVVLRGSEDSGGLRSVDVPCGGILEWTP